MISRRTNTFASAWNQHICVNGAEFILKMRGLLFVPVLVMFFQISWAFEAELAQLAIDGIRRSVNFFRTNFLDMDFDGFSGFLMLEEYLKEIVNEISSNKSVSVDIFGLSEQIEELKEYVSETIRISKPFVYLRNPTYYTELIPTVRTFNKYHYRWRNLDFNVMHFFSNKSWAVDLNFNEDFGDICLRGVTNKKCIISKKCYEGYVESPIGNAYVVTHQAMYLGIYQYNECYLELPWGITKAKLARKIEMMCIAMLLENRSTLNKLGNIDIIEIDILFERITVCGGHFRYSDLMTVPAFLFIIKHQNIQNGCFKESPSQFGKERKTDQIQRLVKRRNTIMAGNCNSHTLGVGVAALGSFLHFFMSG